MEEKNRIKTDQFVYIVCQLFSFCTTAVGFLQTIFAGSAIIAFVTSAIIQGMKVACEICGGDKEGSSKALEAIRLFFYGFCLVVSSAFSFIAMANASVDLLAYLQRQDSSMVTYVRETVVEAMSQVDTNTENAQQRVYEDLAALEEAAERFRVSDKVNYATIRSEADLELAGWADYTTNRFYKQLRAISEKLGEEDPSASAINQELEAFIEEIEKDKVKLEADLATLQIRITETNQSLRSLSARASNDSRKTLSATLDKYLADQAAKEQLKAFCDSLQNTAQSMKYALNGVSEGGLMSDQLRTLRVELNRAEPDTALMNAAVDSLCEAAVDNTSLQENTANLRSHITEMLELNRAKAQLTGIQKDLSSLNRTVEELEPSTEAHALYWTERLYEIAEIVGKCSFRDEDGKLDTGFLTGFYRKNDTLIYSLKQSDKVHVAFSCLFLPGSAIIWALLVFAFGLDLIPRLLVTDINHVRNRILAARVAV